MQRSILAVLSVAALSAGGAARARAEVVVMEVPMRSAADRAGVRVGDVLRSWSRGAAAPLELGTPFDVTRVEIEELPLGPIEIGGQRGTQATSWTLQPGARGLVTRPRFGGSAEALFEEGQTLSSQGDLAGATAAWQRAAATESSPVAQAWLRVHEGRAAAKLRRAAQADAAFEDAAQRLESQDAIAAAQALREWGALLTPRGDFERATRCHERGRALDLPRGETLSLAFDWAGQAYVERVHGRLPASAELQQRALAIRERLAPDGLEVSSSLSELGALSLDIRDFPTGLRYNEQALAIRRRLDPDGLETARSLNNTALALQGLGRLDEAERNLRESLRLKEELHSAPAVLGSTYTNLGTLSIDRGRLDEAEDYVARALHIHESIGNRGGEAGALMNLGNVAAARRDYAAAVAYHERALAIVLELYPDSPETPRNLQNLGLSLRGAGDLERARTHLERAVELARKVAPDSLMLAYVLSDLADLEMTTGNFEQADKENREARPIYERIAPSSPQYAINLNQAGDLALRSGNLEEATVAFERALATWRRLAPQSQNAFESLQGLARVAHARGDETAAKKLFCEAADTLEEQRAHLGDSDEKRLGFGVRFAQGHRECVDALLSSGEAARAFQVLERSRARSLLTMLAERDLTLDHGAPEALLREARALDREYDRAVERMSQLDSGQLAREEPALAAQQRELRDRRTALATELRRASPRLGSLAYPEPLSHEAARRALDAGTVLLSYDVGDDRVRLFVLSHDGVEATPPVFTLAIGEQALRVKVSEYLRAIRRRDTNATAQARELYALLIAPAEAHLERARRVLIAPDGPLHLLPFGSLVRSPAGARLSYLVEWRPVHVVASATLYAGILRSRPARATHAQTIAAFGDPLTGSWKEGDGTRSVDTTLRSVLKEGLPPLPAARDEVREITRLFPQATSYVGEQATEERAKQLGGDVRYVHFACHALLDKHQPLNSALVLSHAAAGSDGDNGLLQAWEIFESVRLHAELVTLSACDTGLGQDIGGEGLASLTRAFIYAGARSVLASHWRVSDASTAVLMRRFYKELRSGRPKDEALQRAQAALIHDKRYTLPFYWAAFQLSGDWK